MSTSQPKDSVQVFAISRALEALAISRSRLRGLTGRELCEDSAAAYLEAAAQLTGDATIGINLALHTPVDGTYTLMYLLMSSPTLGAAIENMVRYVAAAMYQQSRIFVHAEDDGRMGVVFGQTFAESQLAEYVGALLIKLFRYLTGDAQLVPVEVRFVHQGTATPLHHEMFGTAIEFAADNNVVLLSAAQWAQPSPHAAPELHELHERAVVEKMPALEEDPLLTRLRHYLGEQLEGGHPPIDVAARHHGFTPRTFQRRLASLGVEYRTLADQVRRDHAIALLTNSSASVTAIARALGYENAGAFHRAFRRWTGQTPARFRDRAFGV